MPLPDLPDDERAELVRLVHDAIAGEWYFLSGELSLVYRKLRGARGEDVVVVPA